MMGRLRLTMRIDKDGNPFAAVFSKGAGSFTVPVVEREGTGDGARSRQRPADREHHVAGRVSKLTEEK
jgi:hypothetical protein